MHKPLWGVRMNNHRAREIQLERKTAYFKEWAAEQCKTMKNEKARVKVEEALLIAYLRGRGDKL